MGCNYNYNQENQCSNSNDCVLISNDDNTCIIIVIYCNNLEYIYNSNINVVYINLQFLCLVLIESQALYIQSGNYHLEYIVAEGLNNYQI